MFTYLLLTVRLLLTPLSANAAELFPDDDYGMRDRICEILPLCDAGVDLLDLIGLAIIDTLLPVLAAVAIASIAYAGVKMIQSNGDESGVTDAKKIIMTAIIGAFIALSAGSLMIFLRTFVGRATT